MNSYLLSKSSFIKGIQCEKQLYLYKHHYNWRDPISEEQQHYRIAALKKRNSNLLIVAPTQINLKRFI